MPCRQGLPCSVRATHPDDEAHGLARQAAPVPRLHDLALHPWLWFWLLAKASNGMARHQLLPQAPCPDPTQQVFCFWPIRVPEADRFGYSARLRSPGNRPGAADKPAFSGTEGSTIPSEMPFRQPQLKKKNQARG